MELFDDLSKLYTQLAKDVDYLNICARGSPSHNTEHLCVDDALCEDLTTVKELKNDLQRTYEAASAQEINLNNILSGVEDFINFANRQLYDTHPSQAPVHIISESVVESHDDPAGVTELESAAKAECPIGQSQIITKSRIPSLNDFGISETTLNQLKMYRTVECDQGPGQSSTTWEKKQMVLQDMGNTHAACVSLNGISLDQPSFKYTAALNNANSAEWNVKPVARRDENRVPVSDSNFHNSFNIEKLRKTLSTLPPPAPVLSFVAQQQLH